VAASLRGWGATGERVGFTLHLAAQAASSTHIPLFAGSGAAKADAASAVNKEAPVDQGGCTGQQSMTWHAAGMLMEWLLAL
jgi:imidazole glycerol phosphate synthase subunit HisF